jgi:ATP-dependent exoDNAse (exonuclease V) alpha subunit
MGRQSLKNSTQPHATSRMDSSQKKAFCELLDKTFSIVTGPLGSGKSFMAATFCNTGFEGGEIILAIGTSTAAVRQLFA